MCRAGIYPPAPPGVMVTLRCGYGNAGPLSSISALLSAPPPQDRPYILHYDPLDEGHPIIFDKPIPSDQRKTMLFYRLLVSFFFSSSLLLSSLARRRFYPRRPSGQAVVTGVIPFPPRYVPLFFVAHRVQHSHCSSISIECS